MHSLLPCNQLGTIEEKRNYSSLDPGDLLVTPNFNTRTSEIWILQSISGKITQILDFKTQILDFIIQILCDFFTEMDFKIHFLVVVEKNLGSFSPGMNFKIHFLVSVVRKNAPVVKSYFVPKN